MGYCQKCGEHTNNIVNDKVICKDCEAGKEIVQPVYYEKPKMNNSILTILTAIIYPLISVFIAFGTYASGELLTFRLVLSLLMSIGWVVVVILGGIYLIIIPLPIITLFKVGCTKPHLSLLMRTFNGIIAGLLFTFSIIILFV